MKTLLFPVFLLLAGGAWAQVDTGYTAARHFIVVNKDPRIEMLIQKQIQINEVTTRERRRVVPGYRIQVISTTDRNKAIDAKTKIYKAFPELKPYFLYQSPYYRLKVGNFITREEAGEYISALSRQFPGGGVFIVKDTIERERL